MKSLFCVVLLSICTYVSGYAINVSSTTQESPFVSQSVEYIKTVTVYCNINGVLKAGYNYRYIIQLQGTDIQLLVNPRNYNTPQGFNSWSVDNWGYCYYYNI